jgi:hypothetical protein
VGVLVLDLRYFHFFFFVVENCFTCVILFVCVCFLVQRITRNAAARQLAPAHFTVEAALGKTKGCNSSLSRSGPELLKRRKQMEPTLVHNLLAIADTHGFKNRSHAGDEQHIFLETIRAVSITPAVARVPPKSVSQFPTFIPTVLFLFALNQKFLKRFLSDLFIL